MNRRVCMPREGLMNRRVYMPREGGQWRGHEQASVHAKRRRATYGMTAAYKPWRRLTTKGRCGVVWLVLTGGRERGREGPTISFIHLEE